MDKKPKVITRYRIFCFYCDKDMGIVKTLPSVDWFIFNTKPKYQKQKYLFIYWKYREEGVSYIKRVIFCSKKCKERWLKRNKCSCFPCRKGDYCKCDNEGKRGGII